MSSTTASDPASDSPPLILRHQQSAYETLLAIGRACFSVVRQTIPVNLKTASLIIGPSGSGKTFLASAIARELGACGGPGSPFLPLAVSNWVILTGSDRGAQTTWVAIVEFLRRNRNAPGVVIFIDEIDKQLNQSSYDRQAFVESLMLLDGIVPKHVKTGDGITLSESDLAAAQDVLQNRTFLIAAGAFQHLWEANAKPKIGFQNSGSNSWEPSPNDLSKVLGAELIGRFRGKLVVLRPLEEPDYVAMLESTAARVPTYLRESFLRIGRAKIPAAIATKQGCRFLEETMLDAILYERSLVNQVAPLTTDILPQQSTAQRAHTREILTTI